jgi:putative Mg2+ transporter-C (MgtC) family protein
VPGTTELVLRIFFAGLAGLVLGLDRDWKNKPVDFRAYPIVSVTAALMAVVGTEVLSHLDNTGKAMAVDPLRIMQAVMTSIGFLGAGVLIKHGDNVVGTATGASIWAAAGLGLSIGLGYYALSFAAFACVLILLVIFGWFMPAIDSKKDNRRK